MGRILSILGLLSLLLARGSAFSSSIAATKDKNKNKNNILILDHLNINHEKGRHDWLKAFYVDFLQCALDPRKMENVQSGKKTIWANIGAQQFHLPEGKKPNAQVLDGVVTLVYPNDLQVFDDRFESVQNILSGSHFEMTKIGNDNNSIMVVDPWGSKFHLVSGGDEEERDSRGSQPGDSSIGLAMRDLTIHTPPDANLAGIGRFYEQVLGSAVVATPGNDDDGDDDDDDDDDDEPSCVQIQVGPQQTLTFRPNPSTTSESHVDLVDEAAIKEVPEGVPHYLSNYGPHVSMYVADLPSAYQRAEALGLAYVNPRFSRRAYTLDEAIDDCMFRCLDIVDPEHFEEGTILKLEHEVRSVVKRDGSKYKSCPFDEIPEECQS